MRTITVAVPGQNNDCDCGVFLLTYASRFLGCEKPKEGEAVMGLEYYTNSPTITLKGWVDPTTIGGLRETIAR
jgi:Ulp1 family protease